MTWKSPDYPEKLLADLHLDSILGIPMDYYNITDDQKLGLEHMLLMLPVRQLTLIRKYYQDGLSINEIADQNHLTRSNVHTTLYHALLNLQRTERLWYIADGWEQHTAKLDAELAGEHQEYVNHLRTFSGIDDESILNGHLQTMQISTRACGCLRKSRARTVLDTVLLVQNSRCCNEIRNMGPATLTEIIHKLQLMGLLPQEFEQTQIEDELPDRDYKLAAYQHLNQVFENAELMIEDEQLNMVSTA